MKKILLFCRFSSAPPLVHVSGKDSSSSEENSDSCIELLETPPKEGSFKRKTNDRASSESSSDESQNEVKKKKTPPKEGILKRKRKD